MAIISDYARKKKIKFFIEEIEKDKSVLEIGCGEKWLGNYMKAHGWKHYTGMDLFPPADIVGDIKDWKALGLKANTFDYIVAFEVVEHVDIFQECHDLLKEGGMLLVTTPLPDTDWILKIMERIGLNQKRTSPHSNLTYIDQTPLFDPVVYRKVAFLSQWGKLRRRENS